MPAGRPRLSPEAYEARLAAYCARYKVTPLATGIPPFPAGRRETEQHREWIALYKAKSRLSRREPAGELDGYRAHARTSGNTLLAGI